MQSIFIIFSFSLAIFYFLSAISLLSSLHKSSDN